MPLQKLKKPTTPLASSYQKFWNGFNKATKDNNLFCSLFTPHPYPSIRSYQDYFIGESYHIVVGINFNRHEICVGAYFSNLDSYRLLYHHLRNEIETKIGKPLKWTMHRTKGSANLYDSADFDEHHGWDEAYKVMIADMILLRKGFNLFPHGKI